MAAARAAADRAGRPALPRRLGRRARAARAGAAAARAARVQRRGLARAADAGAVRAARPPLRRRQPSRHAAAVRAAHASRAGCAGRGCWRARRSTSPASRSTSGPPSRGGCARRGPPSFPPGRRDAALLGGTVFDLLAREEGDRACVGARLRAAPRRAARRAGARVRRPRRCATPRPRGARTSRGWQRAARAPPAVAGLSRARVGLRPPLPRNERRRADERDGRRVPVARRRDGDARGRARPRRTRALRLGVQRVHAREPDRIGRRGPGRRPRRSGARVRGVGRRLHGRERCSPRSPDRLGDAARGRALEGLGAGALVVVTYASASRAYPAGDVRAACWRSCRRPGSSPRSPARPSPG